MSTATKPSSSTKSYTAKNIVALEGLDPVRKRPGMYIGGVGMAGLHHLIWEVVDNSVDEAMNGHATEITVTLHKDGQTVTVSDNGRGIPIDKHPKTKKPALEMVLTVLHAGGKFDADNYKTAGGLHGVGASVVNRLGKAIDRGRAPRWFSVPDDVCTRQGDVETTKTEGRRARHWHNDHIHARSNDISKNRFQH